jgi:hypothetical protein
MPAIGNTSCHKNEFHKKRLPVVVKKIIPSEPSVEEEEDISCKQKTLSQNVVYIQKKYV